MNDQSQETIQQVFLLYDINLPIQISKNTQIVQLIQGSFLMDISHL